MNDDYLWDKSGEPDPVVARLERALAPLRYEPRVLARDESDTTRGPLVRRSRRAWIWIALAASLVVVALGQRELVNWPSPGGEARKAITVATVEGRAQVGGEAVSVGHEPKRLSIGQWVETLADSSRARIRLAQGIGTIDLEPGTRLRLVANRGDQQRLALERGAIRARVDAPPRLFLVDTPVATAADLGCAYRLATSADGSGLLDVETGWVALERDGRSVMVPAGNVCELRSGIGAGTPHDPSAPSDWLTALARFDFEDGGDAALRSVLAGARSRDAISLWNLLPRVDEPRRGEMFDRLAVLAPPPPGVTRTAALGLQSGALDVWRLMIVSDAFASKAKGAMQPLVDEPAP